MEDEIKNLIYVWFAVTTSLCYCHFITARLPKGKWRLFSLAPIFYIFTVLPLYLRSAFFTAVIAFLITWLANFRLFLFAFDQGPLSSSTPKSLAIFIAIAALPFQIKSTSNSSTLQKSKILPLNLATEIPISAILVKILFDYKEHLNPLIVLIVYCCLGFLLVEIMVGSSSFVACLVLGLVLEPPSDEPYLSTSLREFWSRRWNLTVSSILRQTIYKPMQSTVIKNWGHWAALLGIMASFLVSGLMHELLFWYVMRVTPSWEMTAYFVVQGICVVVEFGLKMALAKKKWRMPWFISGPLTVGFVVGTSFWLFFPPLIRNGVDVRVIEEARFVGEIVKEKLHVVWRSH